MPAPTPPLPLPWLDRAGRLSALKLAGFVLTLAPALYLIALFALDRLGAKPVTALIHASGDWSVRFLLASLAVTPLRRVANWPRLILVRRMLGLAALAYAAGHLVLYAADQSFDLAKVASEIALRVYLTIGFVALVGLVALGATSTDAAVARMGAGWHRLHRLVYAIAGLGLLHYFLQSKVDVSNPVFWSGLFVLAFGWRAMHRLGVPTRPWSLVLLALAAALSTALLEAAWYGLRNGIPASVILGANLDVSESVRPALWVLGAGLLFPLVALVRGRPTAPAGGRAAVDRPAPGRPAAAR